MARMFRSRAIPSTTQPMSHEQAPQKSTILYKKGGRTVATTKTSVAKDGATLTATTTGTDAKGQPMNNMGVYTKK